MYQPKLARVQLKVRDLDRAIEFYDRFLNLKLIERVGDRYALLGGDGLHPELALQNVGPRAPEPYPQSIGVENFAFQVSDPHCLAEAYQSLKTAGIRVAPVDHRFSWALYFTDPDGNGIGIYCDIQNPSGAGKRETWRGCNTMLREEQLMSALKAAS